MTDRKVKAKKEHFCAGCNYRIKIGEVYNLIEQKVPKFAKPIGDEEGNQIGVEFIRVRLHDYDCTSPEQCRNGIHKYEYISGYCGDIKITDCGYYCMDCGKYLTDDEYAHLPNT